MNEGAREEDVFIHIWVTLRKVEGRQANHLGHTMLAQELHLSYEPNLSNESFIPYYYLSGKQVWVGIKWE